MSIDLYGKSGDPLDLYNSLADDRALYILDELHQFLVSDDVSWNADNRVGILGTDVGGRFGVIKAATRDWVRSLALCYTPLTGDEEREHQVAEYLDHLPVPVLALYGAEDELIHNASIDEAQTRNDHGQWLLYEGVGHGFFDIDGDGFDQSAADDAFARLLAFFKGSLAAPDIEDLG
jgi:dienelactone hydrolase